MLLVTTGLAPGRDPFLLKRKYQERHGFGGVESAYNSNSDKGFVEVPGELRREPRHLCPNIEETCAPNAGKYVESTPF